MTRSPTSSGWPYTAPSRPVCQPMPSAPAAATPAATPVCAASRPKAGQAAPGYAAPVGTPASVLVEGGGPLDVAFAASPPQPARASSRPVTASSRPAAGASLIGMPPVWRIRAGGRSATGMASWTR